MAALLLGLVILTACAGNRGNFAGYQDRYDSGQTPLYGVTPYDGGVNITSRSSDGELLGGRDMPGHEHPASKP